MSLNQGNINRKILSVVFFQNAGGTPKEKTARQTDNQLAKLKELIAENPKPKWKSIAVEMGISERHLRRLRKEI
ncbi:hypothetical protein OWO94_13305 [Bacillus paranthracis]|nr:hypothetical protein [Bacillus paranthracis]MDK7560981.1 hypothetical protein [Bacillus paranthracis]